ncbi:MAG: cytochrome c [Gammaproteobacteria bacterium]|jgi:mono/diheme cytochrome c family protein|nr:cytochrome c [Gammaproteobacteria bacterium]MBT4494853.1 cytochrome c [Gammaproteobacteria bacterium]
MQKIPKFIQALLIVFGIYFGFILVFDVILDHLIPNSLLNMYMFFIVAGVLAVYTFTEEGTRELLAPIKSLVEDPSKVGTRKIVFVVVPILVAGYVFMQLLPSVEAPLELRSIHPAPPSTVKIYGKRYDLRTLTNPYRELEHEDPEEFSDMVEAGADVYVRNCHFCHGDKLDGQGPYAAGLNPVPLNFQDVGTIAQLQESFLFWRIATGGPGLPDEAAPWISSMPVWEEFLTEEEIWQVILYLYDYTGHEPRSFEE